MLCCVPKRLADGGPFRDEAPFHEDIRFHDGALFRDEPNSPHRLTSIRKIRLDLYSQEDAPPPILLPCAICARTFMPQSLEKHAKICQRATAKKRKPFDSAKQRIQGTELAEFLPKQETRRYHQDDRSTRPSWKKTHDDFLRTIREARGEVMDSHKQCNSLISSGAPTRANEKGTCATCNRQFGIKAYDRHVAWCKDRVTQIPVSPATNLAKERLEARMRYKAPALKNRRAINREKYSPGSAANQAAKTSLSSPALVKPKESVTATNCNRESPVKQKPAVVRRPGQLKESPTPSGPMKSRLADRMNRPAEDHDSLPTSCRSSDLAIPSRRSLHFPVPPVRSRINDSVFSNEIASPTVSSGKQFDRNETISQRAQNDEMKIREVCSARTPKNIVSARSQGHPKINDIAVNDKTLGMTVQPCRIRTDTQKDNQLVTWKQISRKRDNLQANPIINYNFSQEFQPLDLDPAVENKNNTESNNFLITKNNFIRIDDKLKQNKIDEMKDDDVIWLGSVQNLNQTYLIRDSEDIEQSEIFHTKWKPIKHSPRVEFYFKDTEDEICEFYEMKLKRKTIVKDEDVKITEQKIEELEMNIKNKIDHEIAESQVESKDKKDDWKANIEEAEVIKCKMEKLIMDGEDKKNVQKMSDEEVNIAKYVTKIEIKTEDEKDTQKTNEVYIAELDKLRIKEKDKKDQQIAIDEEIIKSILKYPEMREIAKNSDEHIKLSQDAPKKYEESCSKELKIKSATDNNNDFTLHEELFYSKYKDLDRRDSLAFSDSFVGQDYLNSKDKMLQCRSNTCCNNSLELKKSLTRDRSDKNNTIFLNNCSEEINCNLNPENEVSYQNNTRRNSLDLRENMKASSPFAYRVDNAAKNFAKNAEKAEIDENRYENDLNILRNEKSDKNVKGLNSEILSLQNPEVVAENYLSVHTNNKLLQIEISRSQEKFFRSDNFENLKDNIKNEKTNFNANSESYLSDKSSLCGGSVAKTKVTTYEDLRKKNVNSDSVYGNDDTVREEYNMQGANDLASSIMLKDTEESRRHRDETLLKASANFPKPVSGSTKGTTKERPVNSVEIKYKIRENLNLLRGSTDSLISSVEFVDLASARRPETNRAYERETIEIIRPSKRIKTFQSKRLPDIRDDSAETREDSERSYWERASKVSRSKLINLDSSCHTGYRLTRRNPRVRILPPVLSSSLINRRKNELATRPAWCNYVRRRPDFNLVLKARTGTCKDYDPFLLAEQQMNDLLSDTSDQSAIGSPKPQSQTRDQVRDTLYPLSHSSAFVKYPPVDKRSSLIAPPTEFDDLMSNFSSDSTETNSISREVFLKSDVLAGGKDVRTNLTGPKPVKELGRRVIIDKSKALGVDERRGVVGSADRTHKIPDKVSPKATRPLVDRSNSIRASSAPRTSSDTDRKPSGDIRKTSGDVRKVQDSKIAEGQRSSDQNLNQRNNNYSSLSGSNLSLSSIISSELDVKRSNSMFDELMTSFDEDTFPALRSFLNNESFNLSSPMHDGDRQRNGSLISDEELSSPDSYKPQDHSKLSNDSAYSSLNRKYSHHGRSTNDVASRLDEDPSRNGTSPIQTKCKMSKFCHECGQRFPETAKFCCECGVRRLAL